MWFEFEESAGYLRITFPHSVSGTFEAWVSTVTDYDQLFVLFCFSVTKSKTKKQ